MKIFSITRIGIFIVFLLMKSLAFAQQVPFAGAFSLTSSKSMHYSWINNSWEGSVEKQTLVNYEFFKWLHDTF